MSGHNLTPTRGNSPLVTQRYTRRIIFGSTKYSEKESYGGRLTFHINRMILKELTVLMIILSVQVQT